MLQAFADKPAELALALASDLTRRNSAVDIADIDQLLLTIQLASSTAAYAIKAKSLLSQPLRDRKIDIPGNDWRQCGIRLYGLWQRMRPDQVEKRMAELAERDKNKWEETFPDEWTIDESKLVALYKSLGPLQSNGVHAWNDWSLALRYWVAEMLAPLTPGRGCFDWGGSDGICCTFLRHHGADDVHLFEPNRAAREFGIWLNAQLRLEVTTHEDPDFSRTYGAGICTEVLEHVIDPQAMMGKFYDLLAPGGVIFVTSSFGVPQNSHLAQNRKFAGKENEMMERAGFRSWTPHKRPPVPMLPNWGFWQKPA